MDASDGPVVGRDRVVRVRAGEVDVRCIDGDKGSSDPGRQRRGCAPGEGQLHDRAGAAAARPVEVRRVDRQRVGKLLRGGQRDGAAAGRRDHHHVVAVGEVDIAPAHHDRPGVVAAASTVGVPPSMATVMTAWLSERFVQYTLVASTATPNGVP